MRKRGGRDNSPILYTPISCAMGIPGCFAGGQIPRTAKFSHRGVRGGVGEPSPSSAALDSPWEGAFLRHHLARPLAVPGKGTNLKLS